MRTAPQLGNTVPVTERLTGLEDMQTLEALFGELGTDLESQKYFGPLGKGDHRAGIYAEKKGANSVAFEKKWGIDLRTRLFSDPKYVAGWDLGMPYHDYDKYNLNAHNARKMLLVASILPALLKGMITDLQKGGDAVDVESKVNEWKAKAKTLLEEQVFAKDPRKKAGEDMAAYGKNNEHYAYSESRPGWQSAKDFSAERFEKDKARVSLMSTDHAALEQQVNQRFEDDAVAAKTVPSATIETRTAVNDVTEYIN